MLKLHSSIKSIGLERTSTGIRSASVYQGSTGIIISTLSEHSEEKNDVKQLYTHNPILSTGIDGGEVLVRILYFPLTKEKDILPALPFQAEPLLPYPIEEALIDYQILEKMPDGTAITIMSVQKEGMKKHLEQWKTTSIEPEKISCIPWALCLFGSNFLSATTALIMSINSAGLTCSLIKEGKLIASFSQCESVRFLSESQVDLNEKIPTDTQEWDNYSQNPSAPLASEIIRLKKNITKICFSLMKELKNNESIDGIIITGNVAALNGLDEFLTSSLPFPLLNCSLAQANNYSSKELALYGIPIGLAIAALPSQPTVVDFRKDEFIFPNAWRRIKTPILLYLLCIFLLTAAFYFLSKNYIGYREDLLKQDYVDMLAGMNKSYDQFETAYQAKNPQARQLFQGAIPPIETLTIEYLEDRIQYLKKELHAIPDSFPLFANIPKVSDVLGWLTQHKSVKGNDDENSETRLRIENFSYVMTKRPQHGKKQEKYQVKVELDFTSPKPKWAREFHDALIAPNDWVDPKNEVKWSSNKGKYKTSFFLKDKTIYPSL